MISVNSKSVIFTHIQKTAGTSLMKELLYQNYPKEEIRRFWGGFGIKKLITTNTSQYRVFTGHFPFGIHHFIKQDCEYFTFLREPIQRAISHYNFIKNNIGDPKNVNKYQKLHQHTSLKEIFNINSKINPFKGVLVDNMQTRMLAGYLYYPLPIDSTLLLKQAMKNLEFKYKTFGIQEKYEESMKSISVAFNLKYSALGTFEKKTVRKETIDEETMYVLEKNHKLDKELYEFALDLFNKRINEG